MTWKLLSHPVESDDCSLSEPSRQNSLYDRSDPSRLFFLQAQTPFKLCLSSSQIVSCRPVLYRGYDFNRYRKLYCHTRADSRSLRLISCYNSVLIPNTMTLKIERDSDGRRIAIYLS